jgi:L-malate glycosyltransferase
MLDHGAPGGTTVQPNSTGCGSRTGTFAIVVPWTPETEGGVNQVVINLYWQIARAGPYNPLVFVTDWRHTRPREGEAAGCRTVWMRMRPPYMSCAPVLSLLKYFLTLPGSLFRLWYLIARYDIKVVNGHFPSLVIMNIILLSCLGFYRGKLLLSFHGRDTQTVTATCGLERIFWRWLLHRADAIIFCSDGLAESLRSFDPGLRLSTVRNGVSIRDLLKEKRSIATERLPSGPYILNVSAFEHKKGQDVLIRAFTRLAPDFPDIHLVLLGQKGPIYDQVTASIAALSVRQRIHFEVDVPHGEVLGYMEKATIFAFPSRSEPLGIAMLEAGVFEVPIVASRTGGIPEVINSEHVGMLIEVEDDCALEAALRRLLADAELRASLGSRLRQRVTTEFTWKRAWREYLSLLDTPARSRELSQTYTSRP